MGEKRGRLFQSATLIKMHFTVGAVAWMILITASLIWNWVEAGRCARDKAVTVARTVFDNDLLFHRWNAMQGGVYIPCSAGEPPDPSPASVPEREVVTTSGKRLTMVSPPCLTRRLRKAAGDRDAVKVHLTGLMAIPSENAPDAWETRALHSFKKGLEESVTLDLIGGKRYLRFMRPLRAEKECLGCHTDRGRKEGDILGGISVSVPFAPYASAMYQRRFILVLIHSLLGFLGLIGLWVRAAVIRRHTNAIGEREEQLQTLINSTPDIICFKDGQGRWLEANNADLALFTLTDIDYKGKTDSQLAEYVDPIYKKAFLTCEMTDKKAWQAKEISRGEEVIPLPGGEKRIYDIIKVPLFEADGSRKGLVVLGRDITERKKLEESLHAASRFQKIIMHIASNFINVPLEHFDAYINQSLADVGVFLKVDRAYVFRYDFQKGIMINTHEWCAGGVSPERDNLQAVPADQFPDWVKTHKSGRLIHIPSVDDMPPGNLKNILEAQNIRSLLSFPLMIEGDCWGFVGFDAVREQKTWTDEEISILKVLAEMYSNVEKFRRAEEEKALLREQLHRAQKLESVGRLAGGVAHDLNNLLTPILGYAELLLLDIDEKDSRRESVMEIARAGELARDIVRQLLAFSRKQTIRMDPVNINEVLKGLEKLLRRTIREDIIIETVPASSLPPVMADTGQLEQVIMNLAVNAQDAMPDGGVLTIETDVIDLDENYAASHQGVEPGRYVMLSVSDTGCGMDEETLEHIFEPFYTTKEKEKGTGLGLATVYGIVKQHGGNIWVYSEPGKGTTFKIYLPKAPELPVKKEDISDSESVATLTGNETILLVEDDKQVRNLVLTTLGSFGYNVLTARSGEEALDILDRCESQVHLLLTDVVLQGMNGKELFQHAVKKFPDLKVIYMSGYTKNVIAQRGVLEEGTTFIQKPFSVRELSAGVRETLGG